ncbi:mCG146529, partial [Mus musculus]
NSGSRELVLGREARLSMIE